MRNVRWEVRRDKTAGKARTQSGNSGQEGLQKQSEENDRTDTHAPYIEKKYRMHVTCLEEDKKVYQFPCEQQDPSLCHIIRSDAKVRCA